MGTKKAAHADRSAKIGMWSTIADAVQSGWGPTSRLLVVLVVLGTVVAGSAMVTGDSELATIIRTLLVRQS
jgi:hypothetical protein